MEGGLLVFDLATKTGWAYAPPGSTPAPTSLDLQSGIKPCYHKSGAFICGVGKTDPAKKLLSFKEQFIELYLEHKPSIVAYEAPFIPRKNTNQKTIRFLHGLTIIIDVYCLENGLAIPGEVTATKARKYFTGQSPPNKEKAKRLVELRCVELGWPYDTQDESDALCVLDFTLAWLARRGRLPQPIEEETPINNF